MLVLVSSSSSIVQPHVVQHLSEIRPVVRSTFNVNVAHKVRDHAGCGIQDLRWGGGEEKRPLGGSNRVEIKESATATAVAAHC